MKCLYIGLALAGIAGYSHAQTAQASPSLGITVTTAKSLAVRKAALIGTWTVWSNKTENKSVRMTFDKDDKFSFKFAAARSEGTYEIIGDKIVLTYLKVDGKPAEFEMKKGLPFAADNLSFEVDTYHYEKASIPAKS